ncbi:MAG: hypothetical protein LBQ24_03895 [Candidatus Peribacteria bacterium]|nr:hypothetical protein [Candidatus Peribacteria bacterium]
MCLGVAASIVFCALVVLYDGELKESTLFTSGGVMIVVAFVNIIISFFEDT